MKDEILRNGPLLRRKEAANYVLRTWGLPVGAQTLAKLAVTGGGPPYRKFGRTPLYEIADLDSWVLSRASAKFLSTTAEGLR